MLETSTALLVYFGSFAIWGYRRGLKQELTTLGASLVTLGALMGYHSELRPSSLRELTTGLPLAQLNLTTVTQSWSAMTIWMLACLTTYWAGQRIPQGPPSAAQRLAGAASAMGNGLVYWQLLIPWLVDHLTLDTDWNATRWLNDLTPLGVPLTQATAQTQTWLATANQYLPTLLVILGIGGLIYFLSRLRKPKLPKSGRIR